MTTPYTFEFAFFSRLTIPEMLIESILAIFDSCSSGISIGFSSNFERST